MANAASCVRTVCVACPARLTHLLSLVLNNTFLQHTQHIHTQVFIEAPSLPCICVVWCACLAHPVFDVGVSDGAGRPHVVLQILPTGAVRQPLHYHTILGPVQKHITHANAADETSGRETGECARVFPHRLGGLDPFLNPS